MGLFWPISIDFFDRLDSFAQSEFERFGPFQPPYFHYLDSIDKNSLDCFDPFQSAYFDPLDRFDGINWTVFILSSWLSLNP